MLNLSSWCRVMVERLFLTVPRGCLQFVIVVFPDHTHLLASLKLWENMWDMQFNPSKCQVLQITKKARPLNTKYILHNVELESVPVAKYIGVTIADDLSWSKHIDITTKKANQTFGFLKRNIRVHNKDLKSVAYKTLVRPQLEYASTVWFPTPKQI